MRAGCVPHKHFQENLLCQTLKQQIHLCFICWHQTWTMNSDELDRLSSFVQFCRGLLQYLLVTGWEGNCGTCMCGAHMYECVGQFWSSWIFISSASNLGVLGWEVLFQSKFTQWLIGHCMTCMAVVLQFNSIILYLSLNWNYMSCTICHCLSLFTDSL